MRNDGDFNLTPTVVQCPDQTPERVVVELVGAPDMMVQSSVEHLKALLRMEATNYPLCQDYLSALQDSEVDASDRVSEAWRRKLCEWCYEVVDHFNFDREVVSYALDFLDRSVAQKTESTKTALPKREFQLMAVTALYTAIKLHGETDERDGPRRKLRIGAFVDLSRGFFAVDVIERSEREILEALRWRVNPPTSLRFMSTMLRCCPKWSFEEYGTSFNRIMGGVSDIARYLTELAVCSSKFAFTCKTSVLSYAAILCAMDTLKEPLEIPTAAKLGLMQVIASTTGMLPTDPDVLRAMDMLKELCPSMFAYDNLIPDIMEDDDSNRYERCNDDRDSPICVVDTREHEASPSSPRKRRCPQTNESCRRSHQRSSFL